MKIVKNLDRKGNSKGFNQGSTPDKFGPDDVVKGTGGEKNKISGTPKPNTNRGNTKDYSLLKPREPVLNAVPMPNKNKGNTKNYGVLSGSGDGAGKGAPGTNTIGGTPKPNHIS